VQFAQGKLQELGLLTIPALEQLGLQACRDLGDQRVARAAAAGRQFVGSSLQLAASPPLEPQELGFQSLEEGFIAALALQAQAAALFEQEQVRARLLAHQGIELRVFLFAPHYDTQKEIVKAVLEFENKLEKYRRSAEIDWYPPASSKELDRIYPQAASKEEVDLPVSVADMAKGIIDNKAAIRAAEASIEEAEKLIKEQLGQAEKGRAGHYVISWPMRNYKAQSERLVPAKQAYSVRQSSLSIKEWQP
jgi:hypothetical protein